MTLTRLVVHLKTYQITGSSRASNLQRITVLADTISPCHDRYVAIFSKTMTDIMSFSHECYRIGSNVIGVASIKHQNLMCYYVFRETGMAFDSFALGGLMDQHI